MASSERFLCGTSYRGGNWRTSVHRGKVVAITGASSGIGEAIDVNLRGVLHGMAALGISPDAVARAIAFAIEQPDDVEIGDITIRPTTHN